MDRTLLERMVGAVVLMLVLVLLAPALLDGSADRDSVGEPQSADEPGQRTEVIILNAPVNVKPAAKAPTSAVPAQRVPAKTRVAASAPKAVQGFAVQLGSFSEKDNAGRYAARLKAEGFDTFVERGSAAGDAVYRVYSGPAKTRQAASVLAAKLQSAGHKVMIVELGSGSDG